MPVEDAWSEEQKRNGATAPSPYTGRCPKCREPLDDHRNVGASDQACPQKG